MSVVGAVITLLLAAFWLWAGSEGSLHTALSWVQTASAGREASWGSWSVNGVQGSLRAGGRIASLRWHQQGLDLELRDVAVSWQPALWWDLWRGRAVQWPQVSVGALVLDDQRAPSPASPPLTALPLPVVLQLPFVIDTLQLKGPLNLQLSDLRGRYAYGPIAQAESQDAIDEAGLARWGAGSQRHRLDVDHVQLADGHYRAQLEVGAQSPMPLRLSVQAQVRTAASFAPDLNLKGEVQVQGDLGGEGAQLALTAQLRRDGAPASAKPVLSASAQLRPWATQPLQQVRALVNGLNLASVWPQAPQTALSGEVVATPAGASWSMQARLDNTRPGPWDQGGLPLSALQATVSQEGQQWRLSGLEARLGAGTLQGQGRVRLVAEDGAWHWAEAQADWQLQGIRLEQLWQHSPPALLSGRVTAQQAKANGVALDVDLQANVPAQPPLRLRSQAQWQASEGPPNRGVLRVVDAALSWGEARLNGQGQWDSTAWAWDGEVHVQVPGARLHTQGTLAASQGQGEIHVDVSDAQQTWAWVMEGRKLPVVGRPLEAALMPVMQWQVRGQAGAALQWTGGLAAVGWPSGAGVGKALGSPTLTWTLDVPEAQWQATAESTPWRLRHAHLQGQGRWQELRLQAKAQVQQGLWQLATQTEGAVQWAGATAQTGRLSLDGLSVQVETAPLGGAREAWNIRAAQAFDMQWSSGAQGWGLRVADGELTLRDAAQALAPLRLEWREMQLGAQALRTRGQLVGLDWGWLSRLWALAPSTPSGDDARALGLSGDLRLRADWDLQWPMQGAAAPRLQVSVQRESGDLLWSSPGGDGAAVPLAAGVQDARLDVQWDSTQLQAQVRWQTTALGQASAQLRVDVSRPEPGASGLDLWWPPSAPLSGELALKLPQLGLWQRLSPAGWRVRGQLQGQARLSGTRVAPQWQGDLSADEVAIQSVVDGIAFEQGQMRASLVGDRIEVKQFSLQGLGGRDGGGTIQASGHAQWGVLPGAQGREWQVHLQATADRLRVSNRVDRRLTVSGELQADLLREVLQVRGQLRADAAQIVLPDELAPRLSSDVVVRGTRPLALEPRVKTIRPDVLLNLDFGPSFVVRGQGIDTRLSGQVSVRATPDLPQPRALGEVRTVAGSYRAYGQVLTLETGVLRFTGPLDDPALDLLALRQLPSDAEQRVGVRVGGSAQAPTATLYAEPDLPNVDKLAWLVLGRPASAAGAQAFVLQQAAQQLLARSGQASETPLAQRFQLDALGLVDRVDANDPEATQTAVVLGKRISDKLYLSYEQTLSGTMSTVSMLYELSRRFTLRARAGTENAIDVIFTLQYR